MKYLIWSNEHNAWWRAGRAGYTNDKKSAGRYSGEEAAQIIANANIALAPNQIQDEVLVGDFNLPKEAYRG